MCNRRGTVVQHEEFGVIAIEQCRRGERILGPGGIYREIEVIELFENDLWVRVETNIGEKQDVTAGHRFQGIDGDMLKAASLNLESMIAAIEGVAFVEQISIIRERDFAVRLSLKQIPELGESAHLYYAGAVAPRLVNHNLLPSPC